MARLDVVGVIVSDLQRSGFDQAGAVLPDGIDLVVRDAGGSTGNLSVSDATIDRRQVTATIRNDGAAPRTDYASRTMRGGRAALAAAIGATAACGGGPEMKTGPELTPVTMPDASPGIGFDYLRGSAALHRVLVPAGRSGRLDLIDPTTLEATRIGGFGALAP